MKTTAPLIEPGARWLRCDLHVHTPFDGESLLIVALGAEDRPGRVLDSGSIHQSDIKSQVRAIMEGSADAFRLRRERYGY